MLAAGDGKGTIGLWDTVVLKGVLDVCFFDPIATPAGQEARTYKVTDAQGIPAHSPAPILSARSGHAIVFQGHTLLECQGDPEAVSAGARKSVLQRMAFITNVAGVNLPCRLRRGNVQPTCEKEDTFLRSC